MGREVVASSSAASMLDQAGHVILLSPRRAPRSLLTAFTAAELSWETEAIHICRRAKLFYCNRAAVFPNLSSGREGRRLDCPHSSHSLFPHTHHSPLPNSPASIFSHAHWLEANQKSITIPREQGLSKTDGGEGRTQEREKEGEKRKARLDTWTSG